MDPITEYFDNSHLYAIFQNQKIIYENEKSVQQNIVYLNPIQGEIRQFVGNLQFKWVFLWVVNSVLSILVILKQTIKPPNITAIINAFTPSKLKNK